MLKRERKASFLTTGAMAAFTEGSCSHLNDLIHRERSGKVLSESWCKTLLEAIPLQTGANVKRTATPL